MDKKNTSNEDTEGDSGLFNNFPQNRGGGGSKVIVDSENEKNANCENSQVIAKPVDIYEDKYALLNEGILPEVKSRVLVDTYSTSQGYIKGCELGGSKYYEVAIADVTISDSLS